MNTFDPIQDREEKFNSSNLEEFSEMKATSTDKLALTQEPEIGEVVDVVFKSVSIMKNLVDAGLHGVEAGIRALQD